MSQARPGLRENLPQFTLLVLVNALVVGIADGWGRKPALVSGWFVALPVPFLLMDVRRWEVLAVDTYRLWRDGGYVVDAIFAGLLADHFGLEIAVPATALLTTSSGLVVWRRMPTTDRSPSRAVKYQGSLPGNVSGSRHAGPQPGSATGVGGGA